jgi:integrase/recombinase XerD
MPDRPLRAVLKPLLGSFLAQRRAEDLSPSTIAGDALHLDRFLSWLERERPKLVALVALDRAVLDDYAVALSLHETEDGHRLRASTRHGALISLRVFFRWLERHGRILADPARDLPLPKVPQSLPRGVLSTKEVERVLAVPDVETTTGLRARAILEVLYSTGIRNQELRNLELDDLNFADGLVTVREGKGRKDRVVPIGRSAQSFLKRYLDETRPVLKRSRFEDHVFLSRYGRPFSKTQLVLLLERVGKQAGLRKPLTCHGLRHTCATHMLRGRADIRHIQEMLGHRTLTATQVYTHVAASDLKRVHERCHPREREG